MDCFTPSGFAMTTLMFLIINHPAACIKTVLCVGGVDKNYFGGVLGVVNKGVGLPFKGLGGRVAVGKVGLLVYGGVKANLVASFFEFKVHGHAAAQKIFFLILVHYIWNANPFIGGGTGGVGNVVSVHVLQL